MNMEQFRYPAADPHHLGLGDHLSPQIADAKRVSFKFRSADIGPARDVLNGRSVDQPPIAPFVCPADKPEHLYAQFQGCAVFCRLEDGAIFPNMKALSITSVHKDYAELCSLKARAESARRSEDKAKYICLWNAWAELFQSNFRLVGHCYATVRPDPSSEHSIARDTDVVVVVGGKLPALVCPAFPGQFVTTGTTLEWTMFDPASMVDMEYNPFEHIGLPITTNAADSGVVTSAYIPHDESNLEYTHSDDYHVSLSVAQQLRAYECERTEDDSGNDDTYSLTDCLDTTVNDMFSLLQYIADKTDTKLCTDPAEIATNGAVLPSEALRQLFSTCFNEQYPYLAADKGGDDGAKHVVAVLLTRICNNLRMLDVARASRAVAMVLLPTSTRQKTTIVMDANRT